MTTTIDYGTPSHRHSEASRNLLSRGYDAERFLDKLGMTA
jgi:hypothetical protein